MAPDAPSTPAASDSGAPPRAFPIPSDPIVPLDADGRVAVDHPCDRCRYNLRTLRADAVCPECAHPIAYSLAPLTLRYATPAYIDHLRAGVAGLRFAGVAFALAVTAAAISLTCMLSPPDSEARGSVSEFGLFCAAPFSLVISLFGFGAAVFGAWQLGTPYPRPAVARREPRSRRVLRASAVAAPFLCLSPVVGVACPDPRAAVPCGIALLPAVCALACMSLLAYMVALARREGAAALETRLANILTALLVAPFGALLIASILPAPFGVSVSVATAAGVLNLVGARALTELRRLIDAAASAGSRAGPPAPPA